MASKGGVIVVVSGEDKTGQVFDAINKHFAETEAAAKNTANSLEDLFKQGLRVAGIAVGIREVVSTFKSMIASTMETGVELSKMSQQTGISVRDLSILKYAAAENGVEFEVLAKSGKKLAEAIYDTDTGKLAKGFQVLGISAGEVKAKGNDMYGVMELIADKFQQMPDGVGKNVAAVSLFGRSGMEMIPILNQGSEALEEMKKKAPIFSDDDVAKMKKMHEAVNDLDAAWKSTSLTITSYLAKPLTWLVNEIPQVLGVGGQGSHGNDFAAGLDAIRDGAESATQWILRLSDASGLLPQGMGFDAADMVAAAQKANNNPTPVQQQPPALKRPIGRIDFGSGTTDKLAAARQGIEAAELQLVEASAKVEEGIAKAHSETMLALYESAHKRGLISESQYLAAKRALQNDSFDAERNALMAQKRAVTGEMNDVGSGSPKTGKAALESTAKLLGLQKQNVELDGKLADLDERRKKAAIEIGVATDEALKKQRSQIAEMEAELEKLSHAGASKGVAAQRLKSGEERQNLSNGGATSAQLAEFDALEKLKEEKLQVEAIDRQAEEISRAAALAEAQVEQQALQHKLSGKKADEELITIRKNEIAQLQELGGAYAALGQAGADAYTKLEKQITENMQNIQKETSHAFQQLGEQMAHSMFDPIFNMHETWHKKLMQMEQGMISDVGHFASNQVIGTLFGNNGNGGKPGTSAGGGRNGLAGEGTGILSGIMGLFGKKPVAPTSNGDLGSGAGTIPTAAASLMQMGKKGSGGGGGVQVIINNYGQPVDVSGTQQTGAGGTGLEDMVIQIMLKQQQTNGPAYQAFNGGNGTGNPGG